MKPVAPLGSYKGKDISFIIDNNEAFQNDPISRASTSFNN